MNGTEPKIEIFAPFGAAVELTKIILFRPFDMAKWFVIGFAAFLANFAGGVHFGNFNPNWNRHGAWRAFTRSNTTGLGSADQWPVWIIPLIIGAAVLGIALVLVLMWVGARGRFMFTDCIVRNRGAIVEPWNEFRREGNSFFLFCLLVVVGIIAILALAFLPVFLPVILHGKGANVSFAIGLIFWAGLILLLAFVWALVSQLMVPVMYRRRCLAREAFGETVSLIAKYPGPLILYFLFFIVLALASVMVGCVSACVTCCITAIPYLGTVILLPIYVLLYGFTLMFLRQFGPDYDVWANIALPKSSPIVSSPPPIPPTSTSPPTPPSLPT
jgi:hypothetical protein